MAFIFVLRAFSSYFKL